MLKKHLLLILFLPAIMQSGCSLPVHRIDIRQGNYLTDESIENIQIGMSRDEVRYILGTPMIQDTFHPDRWDYIYRYQSGKSKRIYQRNLTVYFDESGLVNNIEHNPLSLIKEGQ